MSSFKSMVESSAAIAKGAAQEAAKHVNLQNVAIPSANECRKVVTDGASIAAQGGRQVVQIASQHPYAAAAIGVGLVTVAAPAIVAAPALAAAGFTSNGVAAASVASAAQAGMGNVVAGSAFATLQSAAAGGYGVAIVNGVVQGVGGAVAAVGGIGGVSTWFRSKV